jgi:D-xylonolactonase
MVVNCACEVGENPLWHPIERRLYWNDIPKGQIFRYDPVSNKHELCHEGRPVGGFTIQADGSLLLFMDRGTIALWREGMTTEIVPAVEEEKLSRFNDVIADPRGRVLCGTMSTNERQGKLYRLDTDGSLHVVVEGLRCSNGLAFTLDRRRLYYTDSFAHEIYLCDYDVEDGSLSNHRVFARFSDADGLPDGATVDSEGRLWSALWDGACIVRLLPNGEMEKRIQVPTRKASSLTFGGEDYCDIYITTAGANNKEENGELAGALFRLKSQTPGLPEFYSRVQCPG